jgi:hypothetical protein
MEPLIEGFRLRVCRYAGAVGTGCQANDTVVGVRAVMWRPAGAGSGVGSAA